MNNFVIHHPNICSHPFKGPNKTISISISASGDSSTTTKELRVCTNRSCRRQGSMDVLQVLSGIAPPDISVISCGCLSRCGSGPNLVILPSATFVSHCGTAARAAEVMSSVCGGGSTSTSLEALSLRKKAELAIDNSDFTTADILLSQAIDLNPVGGIHHLYKYRSVARLGMNNNIAALEDAIKASTLAPNYPQAYICKGDALLAMEQYDAAGDSYSMALHLDPSIRRSKSFKAKIAMLQEKLATTNS